MVKAKVFIYAKPFEGMPTKKNFQLIEEELPELKEGEYLAEAVYLSIDPYMRAMGADLSPGQTMMGSQVAKVIESKSTKFPVGSYVVGVFGWRTHTIVSENCPSSLFEPPPVIVPYDESVPLSYYLGVLGMPGATAYFGFLDICEPKPGETVVVSGAAGAVGSHVGQIAKIKGCKVIGIAGSDQKCQWLKSLGYDSVINYKKHNIEKALLQAAPNGVDCYFDNTGGEISSTVIRQMNRFGRVSSCGSITSYNDSSPSKVSTYLQCVVFKELKIQGFVIFTWLDKWNQAADQNKAWLKEGKLQYQETITEGFENMVEGFIGMLQGENVGKAVIKV